MDKKVASRQINSDIIVDMVFHLEWKSEHAVHTDGYQASRVNMWRDFLPQILLDQMLGRQSGERRWRSQPTDFFYAGAFDREDDSPDSQFYRQPRLVQHIDNTAIEMVNNTYDRFVKDGMQVLDLMSSWMSHLPENFELN